MRVFEKKGYSLTEVMSAVVMFAIISSVLMIMLTTGVKYWKDIESRSSVELSFNKSFYDINSVLRNSSLEYVSCGTSENAKGHGFLSCASALRCDAFGNPLESEFDYDPASGVSWNYQILYFTAKRPSACIECQRLFGNASKFCPHKYLVKRWYARVDSVANANVAGNWNTVEPVYADHGAPFYASPYSYKNGDRVLSQNILAFKAFKKPDSLEAEPKTVIIAMKAFKYNKNKLAPSEEAFSASIDFFYKNIENKTASEPKDIANSVITSVMSVTPLNTPVIVGN